MAPQSPWLGSSASEKKWAKQCKPLPYFGSTFFGVSWRRSYSCHFPPPHLPCRAFSYRPPCCPTDGLPTTYRWLTDSLLLNNDLLTTYKTTYYRFNGDARAAYPQPDDYLLRAYLPAGSQQLTDDFPTACRRHNDGLRDLRLTDDSRTTYTRLVDGLLMTCQLTTYR